jgi:hypothetical protein
VKIGYDWGYLFLAICCYTWDLMACYGSHLDGDCFKMFGKMLEEHLKAIGIKEKVALIGDGCLLTNRSIYQRTSY